MLRTQVLPHSILELFPFVFIISIIPLTYWFEIWVVLPTLFPFETHPVAHSSLFIFGHFLLFNIVGNFVGILVNDTSIAGRPMPNLESENAVGYCETCSTATPPRAYHCPTCNICILRRDHHCLFTACCIGHFNYRYFLTFLFYLFLATVFCLPFNASFIWEFLTWGNLLSTSKFLFPAIMVFQGWNFNYEHGYLLICFISIAAIIFVGAWFYFHLNLAMSGRLVYEKRKNINLYDRGVVENLKEVLGERWDLVWVSPFLKSTLTCDGITFPKKTHYS